VKQIKSTYKASKIRSFLFFLLLAIIFWSLSKFSNKLTADITAKVNYIGLPKHISVPSSGINQVSFAVSATGFQVLAYKMKPLTIEVDISKKYQKNVEEITFSKSELHSFISSGLNDDVTLHNVWLEKLHIPLDIVANKWIPIKLETAFSFKEGHRVVGAIKMSSDSVKISGPSRLTSKIDTLYTEPLYKKNVSEDILEQVALIPFIDSEILIDLKEITVSAEVSEFTQKRVQVPVQIEGLSDSITIKLLPEKIAIDFEVPLKHFNTIKASDFKVSCNFNKQNFTSSVVTPMLVKHPVGLYNITLSHNRIEYLIFK